MCTEMLRTGNRKYLDCLIIIKKIHLREKENPSEKWKTGLTVKL